MLNLIHLLSISWDLLTVAVSPGLSTSDSILSFPKCAVTLKKPLFYFEIVWMPGSEHGRGCRLCCSCRIFFFFCKKVLQLHWWKEGDWMVNASKPSLWGSVRERTWTRLAWCMDRCKTYSSSLLYSMVKCLIACGFFFFFTYVWLQLIFRLQWISYWSSS